MLVRAVDGGRQFVPTASTRLEPHMRITAFVAPEPVGTLQSPRQGVRLQRRAGWDKQRAEADIAV